MSEENTAPTNSQDVTSSVSAGEGVAPAPAPATESVDVAAYEKRVRDAQAEMHREKQLRADLERQLVEARLAKLEADKGTSRAPAEDTAAQRAALIKTLQEKGEEGVVDLIDSVAVNLQNAVLSKSEEAIKKAEAKFDALQGEIARLRLANDPLYQANKALVEELKQEGFTEDQAFKALKRIGSRIPPAQTAPAGTSSTRKADDAPKGATEAQVKAYIEAMGGKVSAKEIEEFKKRGIRHE